MMSAMLTAKVVKSLEMPQLLATAQDYGFRRPRLAGPTGLAPGS